MKQGLIEKLGKTMSHSQATVLITDDDKVFARAAADLITLRGMRRIISHSVAESKPLLARQSMDLILLDHSLPDGTAFDVIADLDVTQHGQIALVTGSPNIETAARAVSSPIIDYVIKPIHPDRLNSLLNLAADRAALRNTGSRRNTLLVGVSPQIEELYGCMERIAPTNASILVSGESGTGKEVVALALHDLSGLPGAFVAVNCGAIAPELLASQLFGHERGSFTGAHQRHIGFIEQADKGTLFLDEVTEMPIALQVYLLRVLETGRFSRVGGLGDIQSDARIVAATNRDPLLAVRSGHLREDLYYRLADITLCLPPLRKRGRDVVLLAQYFLDKLNERYQSNKRLAPNADHLLVKHTWPGNVRELRSAVQRAYLMSQGDLIQVTPDATRGATLEESDTAIAFSVGTTFAEIEEQALRKTLAYCNNDKSAAARALGVSVRTVHNHLARIRQEQRQSEK